MYDNYGNGSFSEWFNILDANGKAIAQVGHSYKMTETAKAHARLIATVPELLSSLKDLLEEYQNSDPYDRRNTAKLERAGNVIARADGKE